MADGQKRTVKRHLGLVIRVAVAIFACWLAARGLNFGQIVKVFSGISLWILAAVIFVFVFSQLFLAVRWWLFMRGWEIYIDVKSAIKLTFLGLYFNNFLPGSVGGDLVRAWYVAQHNKSRRMASVISVFVDRVLALFGTLLLAITALIASGQEGLFTRQQKSDFASISPTVRVILLVIVSVLVVIVVGTLCVPSWRKLFKTLWGKGIHHGKSAIYQSIQAGIVLFKKPYLLPESLSLTLILQSLVVLSLWLLGREMGIPAGWKLYFVFFPVMWVVGSIPISIAGIGIVEGGLIVLFTKFGSASPDAAAALALSQRAVWMIASLPGLAVYLSGRHLPADFEKQFSIDEKKTIQ